MKDRPGSERSALIVRGGWDGHAPKAFAERVAAWLKEDGFQVRIADSLEVYLDAELMRGLSVVVPVWTMGEISSDQWRGLEAAVLGGVGFAGFHGGMCDSFRSHTGYQFMTGGQFVGHPGGIIDYEVVITAPDDPIVQGIRAFRLKSEQYYMHVDPGNEVLATTKFTGDQEGIDWIRGVSMPVVWKRRHGQGRVFFASYGHAPEEFDGPEAAQIVRRGIVWAARAATLAPV